MRAAAKRPPSPGRLVEVAVRRLAGGGEGVGDVGGKVVFVPLTAPGDVAEVEIVDERRSWCRARLVRLARASELRVEPPCPAFGPCGGCQWQHLAYAAQLDAKRGIVEDALRRIGRVEPPPLPGTLPSPRAYGYRHRARLHAARRGGTVVFGFFRAGSRDVVPLAGCPVLHPALEASLRALGQVARREDGFFSRCAEVRADADWGGGLVRLAPRTADGGALAVPGPVAAALRAALPAAVRLALDPREAEPLALGPGDDALATTGETFTQVNLEQNLALVRTAIGLAAPAPGEEVLDLCCGLGNLSLPAARLGARVLGVDLDAEAVRQARENAGRLGLAAEFRRGAAAGEALALAGAGRRFGLVMLNPPRGGAREAIGPLAALGPSRVLVVSCDPATLARDAAALAAAGFLPAAVRPVDLFPQTAHVETVALFTRARG